MQILNTQLYVNPHVDGPERASSGENPFNSFMRAAQAIVGEEVTISLGLTSKLSNVYGVLSPLIAFPSLPYSNLKDRSINMVELNSLFSWNQTASPASVSFYDAVLSASSFGAFAESNSLSHHGLSYISSPADSFLNYQNPINEELQESNASYFSAIHALAADYYIEKAGKAAQHQDELVMRRKGGSIEYDEAALWYAKEALYHLFYHSHLAQKAKLLKPEESTGLLEKGIETIWSVIAETVNFDQMGQNILDDPKFILKFAKDFGQLFDLLKSSNLASESQFSKAGRIAARVLGEIQD